MRRTIATLTAAAALLLGTLAAPTPAAAATYNMAIVSSSYCDPGGNCITQRIWLQKTDTFYFRTYMQLWCSHSGAVIACRAITQDSATLNRNDGSRTYFVERAYGDTCTSVSSCGARVHAASTSWHPGVSHDDLWLASGTWAGCPATGTYCGSDPYYDTGWRPAA